MVRNEVTSLLGWSLMEIMHFVSGPVGLYFVASWYFSLIYSNSSSWFFKSSSRWFFTSSMDLSLSRTTLFSACTSRLWHSLKFYSSSCKVLYLCSWFRCFCSYFPSFVSYFCISTFDSLICCSAVEILWVLAVNSVSRRARLWP